MHYLVICYTESKYYLMMTEDKNGQYAISAFDSKEHVMDSFKGYTDQWKRDYTWHMSATIGMMQMKPVAIECLEIEQLKTFIISMTLVHISGGAIGRGYYGIEVKEDILKHKQFDIWQQSMKLAGIME